MLPVEILKHIVGYLNEIEDKATILALRKTSRNFDRVARPLVYCTVRDDINQHRENNKPGVGQLQQTAWDVVRQPELACFVRAVRFKDWDFLGKDRTSPLPKEVTAPSADEYEAALTSTHLNEDVKQAILKRLAAETPAGHLSLLLVLCHDLRAAYSPSAFSQFGSLITQVLLQTNEKVAEIDLTAATGNLSTTALQHLEQIELGDRCQQSGVQQVLSLLCLPKLKKLHIGDLADNVKWTDHRLPEISTPLCHNPMEITLPLCILSGPGLKLLLNACAHPQTLKVHWRPGSWNDHLFNVDIGNSLRDCEGAQKLQHLLVDTTDVYKHRSRQTPSSFGSFATLTNLKTLAVPLFAFRAVDDSQGVLDMIPAKLNKLFILGLGNEKSDQEIRKAAAFQEIVKQIRIERPQLKIVAIPWHHFSFEEYWGTVHHQGVDYKVREARELGMKRCT